MARAAIVQGRSTMPQKQFPVVAQAELTYRGERRAPGEVFDVGLVDAIVMGRKKQVRRLGKALTARPPAKAPKATRRGTYERRDMVAKSS